VELAFCHLTLPRECLQEATGCPWGRLEAPNGPQGRLKGFLGLVANLRKVCQAPTFLPACLYCRAGHRACCLPAWVVVRGTGACACRTGMLHSAWCWRAVPTLLYLGSLPVAAIKEFGRKSGRGVDTSRGLPYN
jgi:hypothetical protein